MFGLGKKRDVFDTLFGAQAEAARIAFTPGEPDAVESAPADAQSSGRRVEFAAMAPVRGSWDDGDKFPGGFGATLMLTPDYWTLRARSAQLFETNIYGRGVLRRLITNEINTGLHLEATPAETILGKEEDSLADWSEDVETRFDIWAKDPYLCDFYERSTFGELQKQARMESLIDGDVLVVMRQDQRTKLPRIQLIRGSAVQTPTIEGAKVTNKICHGVEIDPTGKHVAFWVRQDDGTTKRLPAWGEKSGRRIAWLLYGTEKRLDEVRGKPLLSLVLYSLREVDRFRDSTQRKAAILAMLVAFIEQTEEGKSSRAWTAGATRKDVDVSVDDSGDPRTFKAQAHSPGMIFEQLRKGEKPQAFSVNGTVESFGDFETAIIQAVAWALEIPPEILTLSFSSNYSASTAAVNEFKLYLNKVRMAFGEGFCEPIYQEWMVSEVLNARVKADGLIEAWRDFWNKFEIVGAWLTCDWTGNVKPSVDPLKTAEGYEKMIELGLCTHDRASRETTGTKYSKNIRKIKRENEQRAEANKPIAELEALKRPVPPKPPGAGGPPDDKTPAKPAKKDVAA